MVCVARRTTCCNRLRAGVVATLVGLAALVGCGVEGEPTIAGGAPGDIVDRDASTGSSDALASTRGQVPLGEQRNILGETFGFERTRSMLEVEIEAHNSGQQAIAGCMRDAGFGFEPELRDAAFEAERFGLHLTLEEIYRREGLGIIWGFRGFLAEEPEGAAIEESPDYLRALEGEAARRSAEPLELGGCELVGAEVEASVRGDLDAFDAAGEEYLIRIAADPRIAEFDRGWSACMADAGYPGFVDFADLATGYTDEFYSTVGDDVLDAWETGGEVDEAVLDAFFERERDAALAGLSCYSGTAAERERIEDEIALALVEELR